MSSGHSVLAVANEFISRGDVAKNPPTQMQLQKLCYLAHGFCLALLGSPLTKEEIQAWNYGPVYPDLYDSLKKYGTSPVLDLIHRNNWAVMDSVKGEVVQEDLEVRETRLVDKVWETYGSFDGFQLSALTHKEGTPWSKVYRPGRKHLVIPNELIKEYFVGLTAG